jgi:hypothetical protein
MKTPIAVIALIAIIVIGFAKQGSKLPAPDFNPATQSAPAAQPTATPIPISPITWREINAIYNLSSKTTDMQKDAAWKRYQGKRVKWIGRVSEISDDWTGFTLQVKMNKSTWTSDLIIRLKPSQKDKAMQLHKDQAIEFTGILKNWGSLLPITLEQGELLRHGNS